eukprot:TRINITY_DN4770_c0_g4_i1.p1 TRINITY_DN4770_c0_g4~~TRINITY_DN4770_c0_g4_i1.p1  ORF type:complete len:374 (+),score=77.30 TRINITY_DN4770_c0_g4_i1:100-1221(+)
MPGVPRLNLAGCREPRAAPDFNQKSSRSRSSAERSTHSARSSPREKGSAKMSPGVPSPLPTDLRSTARRRTQGEMSSCVAVSGRPPVSGAPYAGSRSCDTYRTDNATDTSSETRRFLDRVLQERDALAEELDQLREATKRKLREHEERIAEHIASMCDQLRQLQQEKEHLQLRLDQAEEERDRALHEKELGRASPSSSEHGRDHSVPCSDQTPDGTERADGAGGARARGSQGTRSVTPSPALRPSSASAAAAHAPAPGRQGYSKGAVVRGGGLISSTAAVRHKRQGQRSHSKERSWSISATPAAGGGDARRSSQNSVPNGGSSTPRGPRDPPQHGGVSQSTEPHQRSSDTRQTAARVTPAPVLARHAAALRYS